MLLKTLLKTKYFVPALKGDHIRRERLLERLRMGLERRLTVMTAPAGFGKSTAIAELFAELSSGSQSITTGRLSLEKADDDPQRFWSHFGHGLGLVWTGLGTEATAALQGLSPPPIPEILALWLNEMTEPRDEGLFALDDFHLIDHREILEGLVFFIDHAPPWCHLILSGRRRPDLPLARWRGRGDVCDITAQDLLLSRRETELYTEARLGSSLSDPQIETLFERCEGWAAALQLATSLLKGRALSVDDLIRQMPARGDVADYMAEEILRKKDEELQRALMSVSVPDAFHPELSAALIGRPATAALLAELEAERLPVLRLDGDGRWMRFHHLFGDFLRRRLERLMPEAVAELHGKTSRYLESTGDLLGAFRHAKAAGDLERAVELLAEISAVMVGRGESAALIREVSDLAIEGSALPADLLIELAKAHYIVNQTDDCRKTVALLEVQRDKGLLNRRQVALLLAQGGALARSRDGDLPSALAHLEEALEQLGDEDPGIRSWIRLQLGITQVYNFELDAAEKTFAGGPSLHVEAKAPRLAYGRLANLAQVRFLQGRLHLAEALCKQVFEHEEKHPVGPASPGLCLAYRIFGNVAFERGEWTVAEQAFAQALHSSRLLGFDEMVAAAALWHAELAQQMGNAQERDMQLRTVESLSTRGSLNPGILHWHRALRLHRALDAGDRRGADRLIRRTPPGTSRPSIFDEPWHLACLRASVAGDDMGKARRHLETLLGAARHQGRRATEIELIAWAAALEHRQGRREALARLSEAVYLATEQGFLRPLLRPSAGLRDFFERLAVDERPIAPLCAQVLSEGPASKNRSSPAAGPALTEKEREVLSALAEGKSNAQIAAALGIAVSTVKTHLKNLFAKLDVRRRTQAVARARQLGCL